MVTVTGPGARSVISDLEQQFVSRSQHGNDLLEKGILVQLQNRQSLLIISFAVLVQKSNNLAHTFTSQI